MPPYEEKDVYALLGLEQPEEPAADGNSTEVVTGAGDEGKESREVAEPGQQVEGSGNNDLKEEEPEQEKPEQSREERSRHAAARRKQEQEAAIQAALQRQQAEHESQMRTLIAAMNLTDPNTSKPVTTLEELTAMQKAQQQRPCPKKSRPV